MTEWVSAATLAWALDAGRSRVTGPQLPEHAQRGRPQETQTPDARAHRVLGWRLLRLARPRLTFPTKGVLKDTDAKRRLHEEDRFLCKASPAPSLPGPSLGTLDGATGPAPQVTALSRGGVHAAGNGGGAEATALELSRDPQLGEAAAGADRADVPTLASLGARGRPMGTDWGRHRSHGGGGADRTAPALLTTVCGGPREKLSLKGLVG